MSERRAVYPGSFDPLHLGHVDIIERVSKLFDRLIVLVSESPSKASLFTISERVALARECLSHLKNVEVDSHQGLTVEYVKKQKAQVIVRGLRAVVDFEYELSMGNINKKIAPEIETILVFSRPELYFVSSRAVKELVINGGDPQSFVPQHVQEQLLRKIKLKATGGEQ